jgi:ACR3 family arsenite transporter
MASCGDRALAETLRTLQPISLLALLARLVLPLGFRGEQIVKEPLIIALQAVPIVIQVYLNAGIAYALNSPRVVCRLHGRIPIGKVIGET